MTVPGREFLDGPGLVEFLEHEGFSENQNRAFRRWKCGGAATVYAADRVLTKLGLHIHLLPDDLWIDTPDTPAYKNTQKARARKLKKGAK